MARCQVQVMQGLWPVRQSSVPDRPSRQASHTPAVSVPPARDRTTSRQGAFSGAPRMVSRMLVPHDLGVMAAVTRMWVAGFMPESMSATGRPGAVGPDPRVEFGGVYGGAPPGVHAGGQKTAESWARSTGWRSAAASPQRRQGAQPPRTARSDSRSDPIVARTADGSYPQCAMQFAQRGSLPRPYASQSVSSISSL
jgi:hypothetical protein